jgi:hypothetical protein
MLSGTVDIGRIEANHVKGFKRLCKVGCPKII